MIKKAVQNQKRICFYLKTECEEAYLESKKLAMLFLMVNDGNYNSEIIHYMTHIDGFGRELCQKIDELCNFIDDGAVYSNITSSHLNDL